jgi:hypothetical protein
MSNNLILKYSCEGSGEVHFDVLKAICGDTDGKSMVDLGCGFAAQTRKLGFAERTYVDKVERGLVEEMPYFLNCDLMSDKWFKEDGYDVSIMLDCIEHFNKESGRYLLHVMQKYSRKQIIFTPYGDYIVETTPTDNPDSHKSGWYPQDLEGWACVVFHNFHPILNIGAFFAFKCENLEQEFERVKNELNNKTWAK